MQKLKAAFHILGIEPSTDQKTVRDAWRVLVRAYHPDMAKTDPEGANRRLAEINAAFDAVCACSAEEVQFLQKMNDRATWLAEKRRREMHAARQRARQACTPAAAPSERALVPLEPAAPRSTGAPVAQKTLHPQNSGARAHRRTAHVHPPNWSLSAMAAQAFEAARIICAPQRHEQPHSVYL